MSNKVPFQLFILMPLIFIFGHCAYADIVSLDANYTAGMTDVVTKLNRDRNALTNGINNVQGVYAGGVQSSGQVKADTIGEENMADDANPRVYWDNVFFENNIDNNNGMVVRGLDYSESSNLVTSAQAGVAITRGYRTEVTSATAHTFTADKWTYAFVCQTGSFDYVERAIGVSIDTDEYPSNCQPLARVSTDATTVNSIQDLRRLKINLSSYDSVYDEATESSSKNLLTGNSGNAGYRTGSVIKYKDASSFTVMPGAAMINGEARDRGEFNSDAAWGVAASASDDGLDVGTRSVTGTTYYVYLVADEENQRPYTVVWSTSATAPTGKTDYLKIGEFFNHGGTISEDSVVNYIWGEELLTNANQTVKVWGNFNASTNAWRDRYNVQGITDNATGAFTISFNTPFSNANFACSGSAMTNGAGEGSASFDQFLTTSVDIETENFSGTGIDFDITNFICIGDQ